MRIGRTGGRVVAALACALCLVVGRAADAEDDAGKGPWRMVRNDGGIVVMDRTVAGTKLREFQGTALIDAPIAQVMGVLADTEHRTEWMKEAVAQVLIENDGDSTTFYSRTGAPWPVADRDVVMRATTTFDVAQHLVRIEFASTTSEKWPPQPKCVRMPFLRGHWYLWPMRGGAWTRAEYQVHAHPGGSLPDWLGNLVSKQIPHNTIASLQKQVHRRRYPAFEAQLMARPAYQAVLGIAPGSTVAPQPAAPATATGVTATGGGAAP